MQVCTCLEYKSLNSENTCISIYLDEAVLTSNQSMFVANISKISSFFSNEIFNFNAENILCTLHGQVFVMASLSSM